MKQEKVVFLSRAMKILFLSFTCEDIGVAMVTNIIFLFFIILEYKLFGTENISIIAWEKEHGM